MDNFDFIRQRKDEFVLECVDNYNMKGKRVMYTSLSGLTRKILYNDFFKMKLSKDSSDNLLLEPFKSDGTDILSFLMLGVCIAISNLGYYNELSDEDDDNNSITEHLIRLQNYLEYNYDFVKSVDDYLEIVSNIDKVFYNNDYSIKKTSSIASDSDNPSAFFLSFFGTSIFRANVDNIKEVLSYMTCLSFSEEGRKKLIDTFCFFAPYIYLSGSKIFKGFKSEPDIAKVISIINNKKDDKKFRSYGSVRFNDDDIISDIEGVSFFLAYYVSLFLLFGSSIDKDDLVVIQNNLNDFLGNDCVSTYLFTGDIRCLIKTYMSSSRVMHVGEEYNFNVKVVNAFSIVKVIADLKDLNMRIEDFSDCCSPVVEYCSYKDCYQCLSINSDSLLRDFFKDYDNQKVYYSSKIKELDSDNKLLESKNMELEKELDSLRDSIADMKSFLTTIEKDEYESLKSKYSICKKKNSSLESKCDELESKLKDLDANVSDLLQSLEETEAEEVTDEVSLEEMVEYLNCFKLCIVGGRVELTDRLTELGLHNFVQATSANELQRVSDFDFTVMMTKFLGHSTFYSAMTKSSFNRDKNIYFNGTNVQSLISICYEFIDNCLKDENIN